MRLSELCPSVAALMAFLKQHLPLVVGKNSDLRTGCSVAHHESCRIRSAAFRIQIPSSFVQHRVCTRPDSLLLELADWIPWCRIQSSAYACADCPPGELADWIPSCRVQYRAHAGSDILLGELGDSGNSIA